MNRVHAYSFQLKRVSEEKVKEMLNVTEIVPQIEEPFDLSEEENENENFGGEDDPLNLGMEGEEGE
jgi:hypothetical protein